MVYFGAMLNERHEEGMLENCPEVGGIVGLDIRQWTGD